MPTELNQKYRQAADEFSRRVVSALGARLDSINLYDSVVRGEAHRDSDIDILVASPDLNSTREVISEICSDLTFERSYTFFISLIHFGLEEFDGTPGFAPPSSRTSFRKA